ncbi:sarcosine oxidase subunit gamma [Pseudodonghicola flavimaris]|uniref:Sarcosine oxidase subunit gamma n=1 Tax=Pseudodonghicola flavimaris TaxID=3050036 RepID=A0ABT7F2U9_9RHOB|nr:sarcosine oxidase subunit gamma [Pseudodonghicola flavimaris]MDK3018931.1 sarcosine oxidase subunit gamma [Pseudodonghicola flavimaris]
MSDLKPISALGAAAPRLLTLGTLTLRENPGLGLASLALRRGGTAPSPFGLTLPDPGGWAASGAYAAFWTGPDQWMIEAEGRGEEDFAAALKAEAPGCSITEQTDGWVAFEITSVAGGAPLSRLMEKLVNVDAAGFGPGHATRTGLEHMSVFLIRRAEDRLAIIGMRTLAGSLWHAIETAAGRLVAV